MIRGLRFTKFKGSEYSGHHGHSGIPGQVGGSAPSGQALAGALSNVGIENLTTGNCWVFASAMFEKLERSGMQPKILDWSGHVEAAVQVDNKWLTYTPKGMVPFEEHPITYSKKLWKIHNSPNDLLKFLDKEYGGLSPSKKPALWSNFKKAAQIVDANWNIPK